MFRVLNLLSFILFFSEQTYATICPQVFSNDQMHYQLKPSSCFNFLHKTARIISVGEGQIGKFTTVCGSLNQDFKFEDEQNERVGAVNVEKLFQWGEKIQIKDCNGKIIYTVAEVKFEPIANINKVWTSYNIYRGSSLNNENLIGYSDKTEFFNSKIELKNLNGELVARADLSLGDQLDSGFCFDPTWEIFVFKQGEALSDPAIIAYITARKAMINIKGEDSCLSLITGGVIAGTSIVVAAIIGGIIVYCRYRTRLGYTAL